MTTQGSSPIIESPSMPPAGQTSNGGTSCWTAGTASRSFSTTRGFQPWSLDCTPMQAARGDSGRIMVQNSAGCKANGQTTRLNSQSSTRSSTQSWQHAQPGDTTGPPCAYGSIATTQQSSPASDRGQAGRRALCLYYVV